MALPETMKAIIITTPNTSPTLLSASSSKSRSETAQTTYTTPTPSVLALVPLPLPTPSKTELLIRLTAISITPLELTWPIPEGAPEPRIPCHDVAGVIERAPEGSRFKVGERVFGWLPWEGQGGLAEFVSVEEKYLSKIPFGVHDTEISTLPVAGLTAYQAIHKFPLKKGMTVLLTGATGSVGQLILQLLVPLDVNIITIGGTGFGKLKNVGGENLKLCLGYKTTPDWPENITKYVGEEGGVDVVIDCIGGSVLEKCYALVKKGGTVVTIGSPPPSWATVGEEGWETMVEDGIRKYFFIYEFEEGVLGELANMMQEGKIKRAVGLVVDGLTEEGVREGWEKGLNGGLEGSVVVKVS